MAPPQSVLLTPVKASADFSVPNQQWRPLSILSSFWRRFFYYLALESLSAPDIVLNVAPHRYHTPSVPDPIAVINFTRYAATPGASGWIL